MKILITILLMCASAVVAGLFIDYHKYGWAGFMIACFFLNLLSLYKNKD